MKAIILFGFSFLLLSCNQQTEKTATITDSLSNKPTLDSKIIDLTGEIISPFQKELNNAIKDQKIDPYYKDIYKQEKLIVADDNKMLSITDSLFTNDPNTDLFFFIVFTKSMNGSDGFYSEALGLASFNFITTKTEWFADYFNIAPKLTDQDMDNWATYIWGEIQISRENQEGKAINELEEKLLDNLKGVREEYKVVIEKLIKKIRSTAHNTT
ncbi:MAG: hypothetical protein Q7W13_02835 [Bacteroidia bacterium]|nr:hypothetical protein [Bacteroidia bacterium]